MTRLVRGIIGMHHYTETCRQDNLVCWTRPASFLIFTTLVIFVDHIVYNTVPC